MTSRHKQLLAVIGLLVVIKWGIMPWLDWQNSQLEIIQQQQSRLTKTNRLLAQEDGLQQAAAALKQTVKQQQQRIPYYIDSDDFRLQTQKILEDLVKQHQLKNKQFFWRNEQDEAIVDNLLKGRFSLRLQGELQHFAAFHQAILQQFSYITIVAVSIQNKRQNSTYSGTSAGLITMEAHYHQGAPNQ